LAEAAEDGLGHGLESGRSTICLLGMGLGGGSAGEPAGVFSIRIFGERIEIWRTGHMEDMARIRRSRCPIGLGCIPTTCSIGDANGLSMEKNVLPHRATGLDEVWLLAGMGEQVADRASSRRRMDHLKRSPTAIPRIPSDNYRGTGRTISDVAVHRSLTDQGAGDPDAGGTGEGHRVSAEYFEKKA